MSKVVKGWLYSREHEWVEVLSETRVRVGITDFAQNQLGDLVFVELPQVGAEVVANQSMGSVESVKAVSDLFSPVSGKVVEVNSELEDSPEVINSDAYSGGWMIVVEISNPDELSELLSAEQYADFVLEG
ncbi:MULTISPECIES: glycine cleavage system protein GcvH [Brevibacillus]|jgi:glycine cleavage system H protein|uniref:Glycine cleavage system H protein n=1 Tax=Brevibacillus parabrevis TaxID=54914 RepID=A0A4Y3P8P6_BREPA|nr:MULTISPECIES: glycine cleavage system protein GcvH [Brevibacillus]MED2256500.1 glycine cleavage system protein GcvH [Brevibacillus parabrevis]NRQ52913.1 glycine cleavage system protein GcvH [Brevibacillus sp. HD1.4A]RNB96745.1 glycine cleavage system protein GcvH [Brevibacillus parabrevis]UED70471.1 glycine cleavage system protein GcvH [Brevibacillus sp. HD3.3A]GEB30752.1 glycine cleavage system H protein [Brevibacillus parabrevis]